jgi:hypothetical protein
MPTAVDARQPGRCREEGIKVKGKGMEGVVVILRFLFFLRDRNSRAEPPTVRKIN